MNTIEQAFYDAQRILDIKPGDGGYDMVVTRRLADFVKANAEIITAYNEAMAASNKAGFACEPAATVIKLLDEEKEDTLHQIAEAHAAVAHYKIWPPLKVSTNPAAFISNNFTYQEQAHLSGKKTDHKPGPPIEVLYKNWRGESRRRTIQPVGIRFGHTLFHPRDQWLLIARDSENGDTKEFALETCDFRLTGYIVGQTPTAKLEERLKP